MCNLALFTHALFSTTSFPGVLVMMEARIATLKSTFERVSTRVMVPYTKIQARTVQLGRLQVNMHEYTHSVNMCGMNLYSCVCTLYMYKHLCMYVSCICVQTCMYHVFCVQ